MKTNTVDTYFSIIYIAGDYDTACEIVHQWCAYVGDCWNVSKTNYVHSDGNDIGVRVERINYPKYPASRDIIDDRARELAELLREGLHQYSYSIMNPYSTTWFDFSETD